MKKRLIIYFNYHPNGQADAACRFAVQQMAAVGQVFFVNNGPLQPGIPPVGARLLPHCAGA